VADAYVALVEAHSMVDDRLPAAATCPATVANRRCALSLRDIVCPQTLFLVADDETAPLASSRTIIGLP